MLMRCSSDTSRSMTVSIHSWPRAAAISARRLPTYRWFSGRSNPTGMISAGSRRTAGAPPASGGHSTSSRTRARVAGSRRFAKKFPSAATQVGRTADSPVPEAT